MRNVLSVLSLLYIFKIDIAIEKPANCEMLSVNRILLAKHYNPIGNLLETSCDVCGDKIISESNEWYIMFKNGRTNVHDENRSGPAVEPGRKCTRKFGKIAVVQLSLFYLSIISTKPWLRTQCFDNDS